MNDIRILVIEDNAGDARLIGEALASERRPRFTVEYADRLETGLERLRGEELDILLLDLSLPDSQGFDTFEAARGVAGRVPILVLTGLDDEELALRAVRAGAQDYLPKSLLKGQVLSRAVLYAIERKRLLDDLNERVQELLEAERRIRENEARLRLMVEQMPAVLWTTDHELRFTSSQGAGLAGLSPEPGEADGKTLCDCFVAGAESNALRAHLQALAGESVSYEQELGGRIFEAHVEPLRDAAAEIVGCIGVALDVTGRTQAEQGLRAMTETLGALVEASPLAILALDAESRVTLWSPAAERTFGWQREEVVGRMLPTVPDDKWDEHLSLRESVLAGERFTGIETRRRDKTGALIDVRISAAPLKDGDGRIRGVAEFLEDINDRKRAERAIRRLASLPEQSPDPLVELDLAGNALYVNQAARQRFPDLQALGTWHPVLAYVAPILTRFRHGERKTFSFEVCQEGSVYHQRVHYVLDSQIVRVFLHDVTEQRRAKELLEHEALHDRLTGLANRDLFLRRLDEQLQTAGSTGHLAVLSIDLDRFKVVNDSLGTVAADQLLATVAQRVSACLRPGDLAGRLAGDEFAVLLCEIRGLSEVLQIAEQVREAISLPVEISRQEIFPSATVGITTGRAGGEADVLLREAHMAMYRAKGLGGGRCEVFDRAMGHRSFDRLRLENELRRAIERRDLKLFYQPIVRLSDGAVMAFEALMRWPFEQRGIVPPSEFIPIAEESGLILPLSYWALGEVCQRLRDWGQEGAGGAPTLHLNVSARLLSDPDLVSRIRAALDESQVSGERLVLEITESVLMSEPDAAADTLTRIRSQGVGLSLDDFGTGYSSLGYLQRFPIQSLKIDRSFVAKIGQSGENSEILRAILALAQRLGISVIAEGVETGEQLAQLTALACDMAQGYLFSRPLDREAARALLGQPPAWAKLLPSNITHLAAVTPQRASARGARAGEFTNMGALQ